MALYLDATLLIMVFIVALSHMRKGLWTTMLDNYGWCASYFLAVFLAARTAESATQTAYLARSIFSLVGSMSLIYMLLRPIRAWLSSFYISTVTLVLAALFAPITTTLLIAIVSWTVQPQTLVYIGWGDSQVLAIMTPAIEVINSIAELSGLEVHHPIASLPVSGDS